MVDFTLPTSLSADFMELIPQQRYVVDKMFAQGKLISYTLSLENLKLWAIFAAENEMKVIDYISDLPLTQFMEIEISVVTFHNVGTLSKIEFCLN
jgi:muconolactone delta-isomerase